MPYKNFVPGIISDSDVNTYLMSQVIIRCTSTTRPTTADGLDAGWHIYETDTRQLLVYESEQWKEVGAPTLLVIKPSDESGGTTDHNDLHLFLPVLPNTLYYFEFFICVSTAAPGTILDMDFYYPANCVIQYMTNHPTAAEEGAVNFWLRETGSILTTAYVSVAGTAMQPMGWLQTGNTAGNFGFKWRATSGTISVRANSTLRLRKM